MARIIPQLLRVVSANTARPQSGVTFAVVRPAVTLVQYLVFNPFSFGTVGDGRATRWHSRSLCVLFSCDFPAYNESVVAAFHLERYVR